MMARNVLGAAVGALLIVATSGCSFFSQDDRDSEACAGIQEISPASHQASGGIPDAVLASELRRLALPPASARLGRDIAGLARLLEQSAESTMRSDSSWIHSEIESLGQKISDRCTELGYSGAIAGFSSQNEAGGAPDTSEPGPVDEAVQEDPQPGSEAPGGVSSSPTAITELRVEPEVGGGYSRDFFDHWIDADGDGCDTRREVLIEESLQPVTVGSGCFLDGGEWYSAFDGATTTNPSNFDIDHFVPLKEAWESGAHSWSDERRRDFANDLSNSASLIAVSASSNRSKGARDPAEWLPPDSSYHCLYAAQWIEVKLYWDLSVDPIEAMALDDILSRC